jgi:probable DNA metabolism protein
MNRLIYDGTFEGLLTAVFEIYDRKLTLVNLQKAAEAGSALFEDVIQVLTDNVRANRVLEGLKAKLSASGLQRIYIAHMGEIKNEENNIIGYIRYAFDAIQNIEEDYGNKYVQRISEIVKMMRREKHRMEAFIRFQKLQDGIYYAVIEPDFNVLPLLIRHFKSRYTDQKWLIYDSKRQYGIYYDLHDTEFITMEFSSVKSPANVITAFGEEEKTYQDLWKNYFKSVNIVSRKNTKLHVRHIPKRYWKYLTEKM